MKRPNVQHDILPLTEFRARMAELVKQMNQNGSPLVLTQHGRSVAVVMSPSEYEDLTYREEFVQAVKVGLAQADAGELIPHEEVFAELKRKRKERAKARAGGK